MSLRVASYNIHRAVGRDGLRRPERIARVVRELSCDVIGLQEVESAGAAGSDTRQLEYLAARCGYDAVAGVTMSQSGCDYGNALLTRARVLDVARHELPVPGARREPRGVIDVRTRHRWGIVRIFVTHLGLRWAERRAQVARLAELVDAEPEVPTVVLGDFNEWLPRAPHMRKFESRFGPAPRLATFPTRFALLALDRILVRPPAVLRRPRTHCTVSSRMASDHLPVSALVEMAGTVP